MKKIWVFLLMLGIGGGGFFSGYAIGHKNGRLLGEREREDEERNQRATREIPKQRMTEETLEDIMNEYLGTDEEEPPLADVVHVEAIGEKETINIPQFHPEDMLPHPITEDEFNLNTKGYEIRNLEYYGMDEVVYDPEAEETLNEPEELLGIGYWAGFCGNPNDVTTVLYIENDTMGTLYRIVYIDNAFCDAVMGYFPPEDDEPDEDDEE